MTGSPSRTLLLVEDELLIAESESAMLGNHGYNVVAAATGEEAVAIVRERDDIDLVLMDINLGEGMDGTEAAEQILAMRDIPVLFLSSHSEPEVVHRTERITSYGYVVKHSGATVLLASIRMAFRLHDAHRRILEREQSLRENQERYRHLVDHVPAGIYEVDFTTGRMISVNDYMCEMSGYSREEFMNMRLPDIIIGEGQRVFRQRLGKMLAGEPVSPYVDYEIRLKDGSARWVTLKNMFYYGDSGAITGATVVIHDITERKEEELRREAAIRVLRESEEEYRIVLEESSDPIYSFNPDGRYRYANRTFAESVGRPVSEIVGRTVWEVFPREEAEQRFTTLKQVLESGVPREIEVRLPRSGGDRYYIASMNPVRNGEGNVQSVICTSKDITVRRRVEQALEQALEEKQALFRELLHRFKNNLAMITSLVGLEKNRAMSGETRLALENLRGRIESMANLYSILHRTGSDMGIRLDQYIGQIAQSISRTYVTGMGAVTVKTEMAPVDADMRIAAPIGLIVNELLTNALKYAFPGGRKGTVWIGLERRDDEILLSVSDDGAGLPAGFAIGESSGFGMLLVKTMAQQLGGSCGFQRGERTVFTVRVPAGRGQDD
ncbi:MAG: PAS domain S-box protein [Spirochaetes bacterium]|nr:PAS domain S-box protein [Spirochaetota bacterium]